METSTPNSKKTISLPIKLLLGAIIGTIVFTAVGLLIPRTFTSSATLLFPGAGSSATAASSPGEPSSSGGGSDQPSLSLMQGVLSVQQPGTSPSTAYLILTSRKVTTQLINDFKLNQVWGMSMERTVGRFKKRFVCSAGSSGDLKITFRDYDPKRAQEVADEAVELLKQAITELSLNPASQNASFLHESLKQAEADCQQDQKALIDFQHSIGGATPDAQVQLFSQTHNEIEKALVNAEADANAAAANVRESTRLGEKMLREAMDPTNNKDALITILFRNVVDRESELAIFQRQYTDKHPAVIKAKQSLDIAKNSLKTESDRQLSSLRSGASPYVSSETATALSLMAKAKGLHQAAANTKKRLSELTEAQIKYGDLSLKLRDDRSRLTLVRSEYLKAQLIEQSRGPQFVVLDAPDLPSKANEYDLYLFTLFGLGLGFVLVLLKELYGRMKMAMKNMGF